MIEIKRKPFKKKGIILSRDKKYFPELSKTKITYDNKAGWCVRYGLFGLLTSEELLAISKMLNKMNREEMK